MRKIFIKSVLALLGLMIFANMATAQNYYDFKSGQLYYRIMDEIAKTAIVVSELDPTSGVAYNDGNYPIGAITIPATVVNPNNNNTYSVKQIAMGAFILSLGLNSVNISEGIEYIGTGAFSGCMNLNSINIPASVNTIGETAFAMAKGGFIVHEDNQHFSSQDGILFDKYKTTLIFCGTGKSGAYTIPATVKKIDKTAFMFCAELTSITLPQILETIGERAFESCYKLDYINLPASLTRIGEEAFLGCDGLIAFTVEQGNTAFTAIDGVLFTFDKTSLLYYPFAKTSTRYSIPNTVTRIANMAFNGNYDKVGSLIQIVIPASVLNIGDYAFAERTNLQSIRCKANNAATISIGIDVFINVPKNSCTLYVPTGSKASYQAAPQWQDFTNIVEQDIEIYPVWVGGVQVNEDNASAITGLGIEGNVNYDPDSKTLTLDGATITGYRTIGPTNNQNLYNIFSNDNININVIGTNSLKLEKDVYDDQLYGCGIGAYYSGYKDVNLMGNGILNIEPNVNSDYGVYENYGIVGDSILLDGSIVLNIVSPDYGIKSNKAISISKNVSLEITTDVTNNGRALEVPIGQLVIDNSDERIIKQGDDAASATPTPSLTMQDDGTTSRSKPYVKIEPSTSGIVNATTKGIEVRGGKGYINIETNSGVSSTERLVSIYDLSGRLVRTAALTSEGDLLSISIHTGIYIVRIGNSAEKVVVW